MYLITTPFGNYSYDCHLGPWKTDSRLDERDPKEQNAIFCSRSFLDSLSYKRSISRPWFIQLPLFFFVPFRSLMIWSKEVQATWYDGSGHSELMCSRLKSEWANLLPVQHPTEISLSGSHRDRCTHFQLKIAILLGVSWGNSLQLWIVAVTWYGESVYMSCTDKLYNVTLKVTYWSLSGATRDVQKERLVNSLNHITWELRKRPLCTNCAFFLGLLKRMGWLRDKWGILKHFPQRICISKSREK